MKNRILLHALLFHLLTFCRRSRSFYDVKWPVLQLCGLSIWWQMFNFVFLCPKRWFQINSRTVRRHFSSIMALNNWKIIAEERSYIFRWRSRFRRRRVCLSSLLASGRRFKKSTQCHESHYFLNNCLKIDSLTTEISHVLGKRNGYWSHKQRTGSRPIEFGRSNLIVNLMTWISGT